jgi:hypothetical protein
VCGWWLHNTAPASIDNTAQAEDRNNDSRAIITRRATADSRVCDCVHVRAFKKKTEKNKSEK